jgi:hypothetical protein
MQFLKRSGRNSAAEAFEFAVRGQWSNQNREQAESMAKRIRTSTIVDFAHGRLTPAESLGLLESIEKDPQASRDLDLVVDLMNEAGDVDSTLFIAPAAQDDHLLARLTHFLIERTRNHPVLFPVGAFGCLAAAMVLVMTINLMSASRLDELTGIDRTAFTWNARGTDNSDIAGAYICFTSGDYSKSLTLLERYLHQDPRGELVPFVHYTAGAVSLMASRRTYVSLFRSHDSRLVVDALQHFNVAIGTTSNRRLQEESRYLAAKGFLMLNRPSEAIAQLDTLRLLGGPRSEEAMQMIERIHALTP